MSASEVHIHPVTGDTLLQMGAAVGATIALVRYRSDLDSHQVRDIVTDITQSIAAEDFTGECPVCRGDKGQ